MPTLTTLTLTPSAASVVTGQVTDFTIAAFDETSASMAVPGGLTLITSDNAKASLAQATTTLHVTGGLLGVATVSVKSGSVQSNSVTVTVTAVAAALTKLVLGPSELPVPLGSTGAVHVQALDQYGNPFTIPGLTKFTSNAGIAGIGTVSGTLVPIAPVAAGVAEVWVSDGGTILSNRVRVLVSDPSVGPGYHSRGGLAR